MLQEYKCPCCGGAIGFDSTIQKMKCPYCDTEFEMETLAAYDKELNKDMSDDMSWQSDPGTNWNDGEANGLRSYVCKSCGGEIVGEATTAAMSCPFCDNPVVMMEQLSGILKPDLVLPFKHDKKAAKVALQNHYAGKRLLPKAFKDQNHIDEIKGLYVPFWLFDADSAGNFRYKATKVREWEDNNFQYKETSYYAVSRSGEMSFEAVPIDGSNNMPDILMESIEPFNVKEAVDFQTAYLAGYLADKYDVTAEESVDRANERIKQSLRSAVYSTVQGYNSVEQEDEGITLSNGSAKYALYPIWMLNTSWNGQKYTFVMNGQTGKFAGDLPLDKKAYRKWLFGLTFIFTVVAFIVVMLFNLI